jgi:hypothetical protein
MWLWVKAHSDLITMHLPFHRNRIPALETFRTLLCRLDASLLLELFNRWLKAVNSEPISIDEKVWRGSKRDYEVPLMVVAAFSHRLRIVLEQVVAEDQDKIKADFHILERMPIEGKILTIDVGFMTKPVLRKIVEKGGLYRDIESQSTGDRGGGPVLALGPRGIGAASGFSGMEPRPR